MENESGNRWDHLNRWLGLGANLGVVFGLIILIIEVQQNAALTRVLLETERADAQSTLELRISEPAIAQIWAKSVYSPETLSNAEIRSMDGLLASATMTFDRLLMMKQEGLVNRERVIRHISNTAPFIFGSSFGKNWWDENAIGWQGSGLYEIADPIIKKTDEDFLKNYYERLRTPSPKTNSDVEIPET
jgi:hypothetical protein